MKKETETILLKTTSIIYTYDNQTYRASATCFFCEKKNGDIFLITNKHVLNGVNRIEIILTFKDKGIKVTHLNLGNDIVKHPYYDICIVPFSKVYASIKADGLAPFIGLIKEEGIITDFNLLNRIEDIYMIGYPKAIYNRTVNLPIIQKGITATSLCDKYNGEEIFLMDIHSIGGSSGSPVFIVDENNDPRLIGINFGNYLEKIIIYKNRNRLYYKKITDIITIPTHLGRAVKSNVLAEMLSKIWS